MKQFFIIIGLFFTGCIITGCKKGYLDAKPTSKIVQPTTLQDFYQLLDNTNSLNLTAGLPQLACDEYHFIDQASWEAASTATERNSYIWATDVYGGEVNKDDWNQPYQAVYIANSVLEGLSADTFKDSVGSSFYNFVKGWAYMARAYAFYDLARNFSSAFDSITASSDLGIPLKLKPEIDQLVPRASLKETYDQILSDARLSALLLPSQLPASNLNRPSKAAAYGLLARIYLSMRIYDEAGKYADSSLSLHSDLIDYNALDTSSSTPFAPDNEETLYITTQVGDYFGTTSPYSTTTSIDSTLINSYDSNDLRKTIYFTQYAPGSYVVKNGYAGGLSLFPFTGLATDEMFLIRSESFARAGNVDAALADINTLLVKRYKTGSFIPVAALSPADALLRILLERRKELVWRGLRWSDLKRLNKEGADMTLTRNLNGTIYALPPNDPKYVFNIPADEINLSGIRQNPR